MANMTHSFGIAVKNPGTQRHASTAFSVSGLIEAGAVDVTLPDVQVPELRTSVLGLGNSSSPLRVRKPEFTISYMRQVYPWTWGSNTLSATLRSSDDLSAGSLVYVTGLTGITQVLNVSSRPPGLGALMRMEGSSAVRFHIDHLIPAMQDIILTIDVRNGGNEQSSPPAISVDISIESGKYDAQIIAALPMLENTPLYGIPSAAAALTLVSPVISASLRQSTPIAVAANNLTLTVVFGSDIPSQSTLNVSGLRDLAIQYGVSTSGLRMQTIPADAVSFATQGLLTHAGNLILSTQALLSKNLQYQVHIPIVNVAHARSFSTVHLSGYIHSGGDYDSPIEATDVSAGNHAADILGVKDGGRPLLVVVPAFVVLEMRQSKPFLYTPNTLTISLRTNIDVAAGSSLVLDGLLGTAHATGDALQVDATPTGIFALTTQPLLAGEVGLQARIDVLSNLPAQTSVTVQIFVENGNVEQGGLSMNPAPVIKAGLRPIIPMTILDILQAPLLGVPAGLQPLVMIEAKFTSADIEQLSPLSSSSNTFYLSLQANVAMQAADSSLLILEGVPAWLHAQYTWTPLTSMTHEVDLAKHTDIGGRISFRISSFNGALQAHTLYSLNLTFVNPQIASAPAEITIRTQGTVVMARADMKVHLRSAYGIQDGSNPGYVLRAAFTRATISQSNPIAGALNYVELNIQTNAPLAQESTLTIHGLAACEVSSPHVYSYANRYFYSELSPTWTTVNGERVIVLTVWKAAGLSEIAFELVFTNPNHARSYDVMNPPRMQGSIEVGAYDAPISIFTLETFQQPIMGIPNGMMPLVVFMPAFDVLEIEQTSCLTSSSNELLLHFSLNFDLPRNSLLTVHGFSGITAADPMHPIKRIDITSQQPAYVIRYARATYANNKAVMTTLPPISHTTLVSLALSVRNGATEQSEPPAVFVSASVELGMLDALIAPTAVHHPTAQNLLGVPNGRLVLYFAHFLSCYKMYAFASVQGLELLHACLTDLLLAGDGHDASQDYRVAHVRRRTIACAVLSLTLHAAREQKGLIDTSCVVGSEQSNPLADASNTFSVNISTNVWLTGGTMLTIVGLQV